MLVLVAFWTNSDEKVFLTQLFNWLTSGEIYDQKRYHMDLETEKADGDLCSFEVF